MEKARALGKAAMQETGLLFLVVLIVTLARFPLEQLGNAVSTLGRNDS